MQHTDIKNNGWIEQFIPDFFRPYAYLARLDRPIGAWLLLFPGWWAIVLAAGGLRAMNLNDAKVMLLFGLGAIIMRAAGCVVNDLWDQKFDKQVTRTQSRPLAAGTLSAKQAVFFLAGLLLAGFLILLQMHIVTILLGFFTIPLIIAYPLMKRITWWPQAFLGLTFNFGALMGWSAITGIIEPACLLLYCGCIFWTIGYDTIYAHQDKEDDARIGLKSSALKLGQDSPRWVSAFYAAAFLLFTLSFILATAGILSYLCLTVAAWHLYRQIKNWDINNHQSSLDTFKSNRDLGFLLLLAALL